jgi:hypothetical protein
MNKNLQKYVDRYNKQRLTIGVLSIGLGLVIAVCNERYAYNALFGPFPITGQELAQIKDIYKSRKYFVIVQGRGLIDSGIGWVKVKRNRTDKSIQSETPTDLLQLLIIDDYILPLKVSTLGKNPTVIGELSPPEKELTDTLVEELGPEGASHLLPLQLEKGDSFKAMLFFYFAALITLGGMGTTKLLQIFVLWKDPENHPLGKAIAKLGSYNTMRLAVDEDFDSGSEVLGSGLATISKKWVLLTVKNNPVFIPIRDLVWGYGARGKETTNFVTSSSYSLVLCTTDGKELQLSLPDRDTNALLTALTERAPWMMVGFDGKTALRWNAHKKTVIAEVEQKRDQTLRDQA